MCVYSQIVDYETDRWKKRYWTTEPWKDNDISIIPVPYNPPNYKEKEKLKKEVEELKKLLKLALKFDKNTDQEECESEDKKKILSDMAKQLGIEIEFPDEEE